jgi:hypothetical protein
VTLPLVHRLAALRRSVPVQAALLGCLALCVYLANGRYIGAGDTKPAELLPISLLQEGNLYLDQFAGGAHRLPYWFVQRNGHVISFYPIVPGLLNVPAHVLARWMGWDEYAQRLVLAKWTAAGATAASVACLFLALIPLCERRLTAAFVAGMYAVATCAWSVASQGLWQHGPGLLFLTAALACLVRADRPGYLAAAGFLYGMAVFTRPANIVFALPAAVFVLCLHRRRLGSFLLGAALPAVCMAWYSLAYWGSLLSLGQGQRLGGTDSIHQTNLGFPVLKGMAGVLFSPGRGLFVFSPIFLFAVPPLLVAIWPRARVRPVLRMLAAGALADLTLYSCWSVWWGGWSFGYRMLLEMLPALCVFLAVAWEGWIDRRAWRRLLFFAALLFSFYVQVLGALEFPSGWNARVRIDVHPERNWDWRDTELRACQRKLLAGRQTRN